MYQLKEYIAACLVACLSVVAALTAPASAAEEKPKQQILFTNVDVFDGFNEDLIKDANVLVEGNVITAASSNCGATALPLDRKHCPATNRRLPRSVKAGTQSTRLDDD